MATTKQKIAVKKMSENIRNGGSKTTGEILRASGYSDSVSKSPQRVTESKGWQELMEEYFPSEYLLKKHRKLLNKKEIVTYQGEYTKTNQPHSDVKYALDMLYKLKGAYKQVVYIENSPYKDLTDEELDERIRELKKELRVK
jgi:hypothetical protein